MRTLPQQVLDAIAAVAGEPPVSLHEPRFTGNESAYLEDCLKTTFVSSVGPYVDRFEADLARFTGAKHVVAVVNGTAALHAALLLAGVCPEDEVLVPALTFVATANAVRYCGAIPHFVDSDERTLGLAVAPLREHLLRVTTQHEGCCINTLTGRPIRAIVPMHTFGHPSDLDGLAQLARDLNLTLVEDAAESLGSLYKGQHTGTFGRIGVLSFNGNKTITTGGGGALLINDSTLASRAKHLTTTARLSHRWAYEHDEVGFNYRLPNINAALGCAQLERLPSMLDAKRRLFVRYREAFRGVPQVRVMSEPEGCHSNYWLQTLILSEDSADCRDEILTATNEAGFGTRPVWNLMHRLKPFEASPRASLPIAESLEQRIVNIPSSHFLA